MMMTTKKKQEYSMANTSDNDITYGHKKEEHSCYVTSDCETGDLCPGEESPITEE